MRSRLIRLNAPAPVLEAIVDVWRETGRRSEMIVYGRSMEPAIPKGSKVAVDHRLDPIAVGDVIVFRNVDHLTAHRVVGIEAPGAGSRVFVTRGDVNSENDAPVEERFVLGKVIGVIAFPPAPVEENR